MSSIIIAIGLGFAVTEWREDRRDAGRATDAVSGITRELRNNHRQLSSVAPYYRSLAQTLDSLIRTDGDALLEERPVPGWRGLSPPLLRSASYSAATSTGALEHVPFELADLIAQAYEVQGDMSLAVDQAMGTAIAGGLTRQSEWLRIFALMSELATAAEQVLGETLGTLQTHDVIGAAETGT